MKIYRKILYKRRRNNCFNFFLLITLNIKEIFFCEIVEKTRFLFASLCINWNMCWNVHTRIGYIARCNSLFSSFLIVNFLSFYFYSLCKKGTKIDRILYNITLYKNVLQFCFICWAARALSFLKFIVVQNGILMLLICGRWNRMEKFWGNCQHPATTTCWRVKGLRREVEIIDISLLFHSFLTDHPQLCQRRLRRRWNRNRRHFSENLSVVLAQHRLLWSLRTTILLV